MDITVHVQLLGKLDFQGITFKVKKVFNQGSNRKKEKGRFS